MVFSIISHKLLNTNMAAETTTSLFSYLPEILTGIGMGAGFVWWYFRGRIKDAERMTQVQTELQAHEAHDDQRFDRIEGTLKETVAKVDEVGKDVGEIKGELQGVRMLLEKLLSRL